MIEKFKKLYSLIIFLGGVIDCLAQGMPTPSVTWHTQQNFGAIWSPPLEFSNDLWTIYQHNNSIR